MQQYICTHTVELGTKNSYARVVTSSGSLQKPGEFTETAVCLLISGPPLPPLPL